MLRDFGVQRGNCKLQFKGFEYTGTYLRPYDSSLAIANDDMMDRYTDESSRLLGVF